jgi:hypothetical protein
LTLRLSIPEIWKVTTRRGLNFIASLVRGLRPRRAFLRLTWNLPNPLTRTSSSPARVFLVHPVKAYLAWWMAMILSLKKAISLKP